MTTTDKLEELELESKLLTKQIQIQKQKIEICTHLPLDSYKDACQRLPIKGCEGCWYRHFKIVPSDRLKSEV